MQFSHDPESRDSSKLVGAIYGDSQVNGAIMNSKEKPEERRHDTKVKADSRSYHSLTAVPQHQGRPSEAVAFYKASRPSACTKNFSRSADAHARAVCRYKPKYQIGDIAACQLADEMPEMSPRAITPAPMTPGRRNPPPWFCILPEDVDEPVS